MIPSQFYPTVNTLYGNILLTARVTEINEFTGDDPVKPYYMGYVDGNDFPEMFEFNTWTVSGTTVMIEHPFKENHPWAYATWQTSSAYRTGEALVNDGNGNWVRANKISGSISGNWGLINGGRLASSTMCDQIRLHLFLFDLGANTSERITYDTTFEMVENFIYNDGQFDLTSTTYGNISIKYDQFNEDGIATISNVNIMFCGWQATNATRSCGEGAASTTVRIAPIFRSTVGDTDKYMYITPDGSFSYGGGDNSLNSFNEFRIESAALTPVINQAIPVQQDGFYFGMPAQNLDLSGLADSTCFLDKRYYVQYQGTLTRIVFSMLIEEMYKFICMWNKVTKDNAAIPPLTTTYTTLHKVSLFDENNKPLFERISGNYEDIKDKLQPWQYPENDVTVNDFDVADMPPYVPPGPGGDQDEGDIGYNRNIPAGISAFTTSYILSAGALSYLGRDLWSKVADPTNEMITNFFHIKPPSLVSPTPAELPEGTIVPGYELTMANIIDYCISLKYFPFNLASYTSNHISSPANTIKIGSGTQVISTGGYNSLVTNTNIVVLDGGSVTVPTKYNSFLDHEPYSSVSVYVPYCGTVSLQPSVIRGATLHLAYGVDLNTGGCQAILMKSGDGASFPIATINGTMGFDVLLTGNNAQTVQANATNAYNSATLQQNMNTASAILNAGISTVSAAATGGAGAASAIGQAAGVMTQTALKNVGIALNYSNDKPQLLGTSPLTAGSSSIMAALISPQVAYVQIRYRIPCLEGYELVGGLVDKPSLISSTNGMGFVKIVNPRLDGLNCTAEEVNMIKEALAGGIWT